MGSAEGHVAVDLENVDRRRELEEEVGSEPSFWTTKEVEIVDLKQESVEEVVSEESRNVWSAPVRICHRRNENCGVSVCPERPICILWRMPRREVVELLFYTPVRPLAKGP